MTKCVFFTNLDEAQPYVRRMNESTYRNGSPWVGGVPRKGERVEFERQFRKGHVFDMEVVAVTHSSTGSEARIELHVPSTWGQRSLREWIEWFKRHERES
jgi:hypothetical protein